MVTQYQSTDVTPQNVTKTKHKSIFKKWWLYILIFVFVLMISAVSIFLLNRTNAKDISNVKITSITSESVVISWNTTKPSNSIVYLTDKTDPNSFDLISGYKYFDFRDYQEIAPNQYVKIDQGKYYSHYVTVSGLASNTEYTVAISDLILPIENTKQVIRTYSQLESLATPNPTYGAIIITDENKDNPIVTLSFVNSSEEKSQVLSALASGNNTWTIDIANMRFHDSDELFVFDNETVAELTATVDGKETKLTFSSENISPCPDIKISTTNNFEGSQSNNGILINRVFAIDTLNQSPVMDEGGYAPKSGGSAKGVFKPQPVANNSGVTTQNSVADPTDQQSQSQPAIERPARVGDRCELDEDDSCGQNLKCIRNGNQRPTCQKIDFCYKSEDCSDARYDCVKNKCVRDFPTVFVCSKDENCGNNQFCIDGKCLVSSEFGPVDPESPISNTESCHKNSDCSSSEYCAPLGPEDIVYGYIANGSCIKEKIGRSCYDVVPCTQGMACENNKCVYQNTTKCQLFSDKESCENTLDQLACEYYGGEGMIEGVCSENSKKTVCNPFTGDLYRNNILTQTLLYSDCDCVVVEGGDDECASYMLDGQVNCESITQDSVESNYTYTTESTCLARGCAWIDSGSIDYGDRSYSHITAPNSNDIQKCIDPSQIDQYAITPDKVNNESDCLKYGYNWRVLPSGDSFCSDAYIWTIDQCEDLTQYGKDECNEQWVLNGVLESCVWVEYDANNDGTIVNDEGSCKWSQFQFGNPNEQETVEWCTNVNGETVKIDDQSDLEHDYCKANIAVPSQGATISSIFPDTDSQEIECDAKFDRSSNRCSADITIKLLYQDYSGNWNYSSITSYEIIDLDYDIETCTTDNVCNNTLNLSDESITLYYEDEGDIESCNSFEYYVPGGVYPCDLGTMEVGTENATADNSFLKLLKNDVNAQESIISDPVLQPGIYTFAGKEDESLLLSEEVHVAYFDDQNKNNVRDEGERLLTPYEAENLGVGYVMVESAKEYQFKQGWNLVSFPIVVDKERAFNAFDLYNYLRARNILVEDIATYREGKFETFSVKKDINNEDVEVGNNFTILPGEAYFIKSINSGTASLVGYQYEGSLPLSLLPGWNLVNIYNQDVESYQAFDVLKQMEDQGVVADTLSKWENSKYNSVIYSDNMKYGYDYKVFPTAGYFVRVLSESGGTYSPE